MNLGLCGGLAFAHLQEYSRQMCPLYTRSATANYSVQNNKATDQTDHIIVDDDHGATNVADEDI